jgi:glycosyltransferase involved in cell wall biosynthesis
MKENKISVSMIVKNEEIMLADCLNSIKKADEIVIVDTGSEDDTIKIIKQFSKDNPKKVILKTFKWIDDFSAARNESLKYCTKDFILIIDADETLEAKGIEKLKRRLKHYDDLTLKLKVQTDIEQLWSPRLFQNGKGIHYSGAIHNQLSTNEGGQLDVEIRSKTSPAHEKDPERTLRILSKELKKDPLNLRNQYYMARECLRFDDIAGSVYWFERRCEVIDWTNEQADALFLLGDCYSRLGRGQIAVETWVKVILINPEFKAAYQSLASSFRGPNQAKWLELAKLAKNTNLLFLR